VLPRFLHCVADAPTYRAEEKIGHSGRDDRLRKPRYMILGKGIGWELVGSGLGSLEGDSFARVRLGLVDCVAGSSGAGGVAGSLKTHVQGRCWLMDMVVLQKD